MEIINFIVSMKNKTTQIPEEKLLSRKKAAEMLAVSVSTIKRIEKQGKLQPLVVGVRSIRFRRSDIAALMSRRSA